MPKQHRRHNFNAATKRRLAEMAGHACSDPNCRAATTGGKSIGVAAHICAAAPGGPRYDSAQTERERMSYENGIWLCPTHGTLIDADIDGHPVDKLLRWRAVAEKDARSNLGVARQHETATDVSHQLMLQRTMLDVTAIHDIRGIRSRRPTPQQFENEARLLWRYLDDSMSDYAPQVFHEVQCSLALVTNGARAGMPRSVAYVIAGLTAATLPTTSFVSASPRVPTDDDLLLLMEAADIGLNLTYDGARYLTDLHVTNAGSRILWETLRFAHVNKLTEEKTQILEAFDTAAQGAADSRSGRFDDACRWLEFQRDDALALNGDPLPRYPADLAAKLH